MAIKYVDQDRAAPRRGAARAAGARADGEARFATPVEAPGPVNPDPAAELPFTDPPAAEKQKRPRRA